MTISPIKEIPIGSRVFFEKMPGYVVKDEDEICIMDNWIPGCKTNSLNMKAGKKDVFFYKNLTKEEFIQDALDSGLPMRAGKFLVPEFVDYIVATIDDIKRLGVLFDTIDDRHRYELCIYESYLENVSFTLTDQQRKDAYDVYVECKRAQEVK